MVSLTSICNCRDMGIKWLCSKQQGDGSVPADFGYNHGPCTYWPTAQFVGTSGVPSAAKIRASRYLWRHRVVHPAYGIGYGFNQDVPCDADTTFEVAIALNEKPEIDKIMALRLENGGFATFTVADAQLIHPNLSVIGWTSSHLEIMATLLRLARLSAQSDSKWLEVVQIVEADLVEHVLRHGWRAYWYESPVVAAALVGNAMGGFRADLPPIPLPTNPYHLSLELGNNPFTMACAIEVALLYDFDQYREVIAHLAEKIVQMQHKKGSWRPLRVISVTYPDSIDPDVIAHSSGDYGLQTITAMRVISALNRLVTYMQVNRMASL